MLKNIHYFIIPARFWPKINKIYKKLQLSDFMLFFGQNTLNELHNWSKHVFRCVLLSVQNLLKSIHYFIIPVRFWPKNKIFKRSLAILAHFDPILPYKSKGILGNFWFITLELTQRFWKFRAIFSIYKNGGGRLNSFPIQIVDQILSNPKLWPTKQCNIRHFETLE